MIRFVITYIKILGVLFLESFCEIGRGFRILVECQLKKAFYSTKWHKAKEISVII